MGRVDDPDTEAPTRNQALNHVVATCGGPAEQETYTVALLTTAVDAVRTLGNLALGAAPWLPGVDAYALDGLTADELTAAIAPRGSGAVVVRIDPEFDSAGTSDRVRLHLTWNAAGQSAGLATTVFVKGTPGAIVPRMLASAFGLAEFEPRFYNEIQPAIAELTMTSYLARYGRGGRYVVALAELDADEVTFYHAGDEPPLSHSESMMDALGTLHGRFWRSPRFDADLSWVPIYRRRPGYPFAHPTVRLLSRKFLGQDRDIPATVRRATEFYVDNRAALDRAWEALPVTLVHGDCHTGNTFERVDGTSGFYDWQNIHKMNGMRDVAYYIAQSLTSATRQAHDKHLIERYLDSLARHGAGPDAMTFDAAYDAYRMVIFDSWLAAFTTLALGGLQEAAAMEIAARRCMEALTDLDTEGALRAAARRYA